MCVRCVGLGGADGVGALDVIVVDADRGCFRAAAEIDTDIVFDAAVAGVVDDLIPGDFYAGNMLNVIELGKLDFVISVFPRGRRLRAFAR